MIKTTFVFLFLFTLTAKANTIDAKKTTAAKKIIILGDSLTEGYGVPKEQAFPALVETQLNKEGFNIEVINAGISGSTSSSAPSRLKWLIKSKPDVVFIALGSNDGLRGIDTKVTKNNLKQTIHMAKKENIQVWLAALQVPPNYGKYYVSQFASLFKELAKEESVPLSPFLLDGVAGNKKLNQPDGIHPNEEGHKVIAKNVAVFFKNNL